jgi:hypothetical protein
MTSANWMQVGLLVCSGTVALLSGSKKETTRRVGFCFGVAGQPFWFLSAWFSGQWAICLLCFWYAFCYIRGIVNTKKQIT